MDYRNADGSVAEMCGNGVRVYARYLAERGWLDGRELRARHPRRGALRCASTAPRSRSTWARRPSARPAPRGSAGGTFAGIAVDVGNPHLACVTDAALDDAGPHPGPRARSGRCSRTG